MLTLNEIAFKEPMFYGYGYIALLLFVAIIGPLVIYYKKTIANHSVTQRIKGYWKQPFMAATGYTYEKERKSFSIFHHNADAPLVAINALINKVPLQDEESNRMVAGAKDILSNTLQRIKNISINPLPTMLDKLKLMDALHHLGASLSGASGLTIYLATNGDSSLSLLQELAIYKNVQKLANNMFKENHSNHLNIELNNLNGEVHLMLKG